MAILKVASELREGMKRSDTRALRKEERVPAVYYFHKTKPIALSITLNDLKNVFKSGSHVFDIELGNKHHKCIIKAIQYHPVSDEILHIDFMGVTEKERIETKISISTSGIPVGVRIDGGVLSQSIWELRIKCKISEIPQDYVIDVTELHLNESIAIKDIEIPNVELLDKPTTSIVSVVKATGASSTEEEEAVETDESEETTEE